MRLILLDRDLDARRNFDPVCLSRPIWELRCGITSLGEKLIDKAGCDEVACFVPDYMGEAYRARCAHTDSRMGACPVNDPTALAGDDLLLVHPRLKAETWDVPPPGQAQVGVDADGSLLYARIPRGERDGLDTGGIDALVASAVEKLPAATVGAAATWEYLWDLVLANPEQIAADFAVLGRSGIEGNVEQPSAIRGAAKDVYVAPGATVHPMAVFDAANGPIYIDEDAEIHPFSRVEGPCYIGKQSVVLGAKCREGNSVGPVCRIGGEVEESIIQGYSNKYHDGFLGHAYVGEWVNLGAGTTNSDLKNDYSSVSVVLDGRRPVDTGSAKVGSLIGDHTKTSIGTLFNTGACVGAMCLIVATGKPLAKFIPSFSWLLDGVVTKGFGKGQLYKTAAVAMQRRKRKWTDAEQAMWDAVFELTAPERSDAVKRGRRAMRK